MCRVVIATGSLDEFHRRRALCGRRLLVLTCSQSLLFAFVDSQSLARVVLQLRLWLLFLLLLRAPSLALFVVEKGKDMWRLHDSDDERDE